MSDTIPLAVAAAGNNRFQCPFAACAFTGDRAGRVREHHLAIHRHIAPWPCPRCHRGFVAKQTLRNHIGLEHAAEQAQLVGIVDMQRLFHGNPVTSVSYGAVAVPIVGPLGGANIAQVPVATGGVAGPAVPAPATQAVVPALAQLMPPPPPPAHASAPVMPPQAREDFYLDLAFPRLLPIDIPGQPGHNLMLLSSRLSSEKGFLPFAPAGFRRSNDLILHSGGYGSVVLTSPVARLPLIQTVPSAGEITARLNDILNEPTVLTDDPDVVMTDDDTPSIPAAPEQTEPGDADAMETYEEFESEVFEMPSYYG